MRLVLVFLLVLSGCGQGVVALRDDWTGALALHTVEYEIYRDQFTLVEARPIVIISDTGTGYAVLTNVRRRDTNAPQVMRMTSAGVTLPYVLHDHRKTHCIDGCQNAEIGAIHLSHDAFVLAAQIGLPLRIWGLRGRFEGSIPASAFAEVLSQL